MKTQEDNVLTTDEEIQKAISEELGEEIVKGEDGEDIVKAEGEEEEDDSDTDTNAKLEGGEEDEGEDDEDVSKSKKKAEKEGKEGDEDEEEVAKAIDASPILKAFSEKQDALELKVDQLLEAVGVMRKNNAVITKGLLDKVSGIDAIEKGVETLQAFGSQRRTFGAAPMDRFEKGVGEEGEPKVLMTQAAEHKPKILDLMQKAIFTDSGEVRKEAAERGLVNSMRLYNAAGSIEKGIWENEFAKEGYLLK